MRTFVTFVAVALLGQGVAQATNIALNAPVINYSSFLNVGSQFVVAQVDDGVGVSTPQLGVTSSEGFGAGYWLSATGGTEFFILDLDAPQPIGQIRIANDANGGILDRDGLAFEVLASNSLTSVSVTQAAGTNTQNDDGTRLNNPTTLASGTLSLPTSNIITFDVFNPSNNNLGAYRYIEYVQLSTLALGGGGPSYGGGLDEFQIIGGNVPEPSSVVLACVAGCGLMYVVRRRK